MISVRYLLRNTKTIQTFDAEQHRQLKEWH